MGRGFNPFFRTLLEVARREIARRKDVFTLDCYAWALAANGQYQEANTQIQKALQVGVKDPKILLHANYISQHLNQPVEAE